MSWDVSVQRFSQEYVSIEDIPDTEILVPLGSRTAVHSAVSKYFPQTDWTDPAWGVYDGAGGSIEFSLGKDEPVTGFMMHIRATSELIPAIVAMCRTHAWQALDCSTGSFLEKSSNPEAGQQNWSTYRDHAVGKSEMNDSDK